MCEHLGTLQVFHMHQPLQTPASVSQTLTGSPCNVIIGDIKEDEEAFIIGRLGFMGVKDGARHSHCLQVQHVNADILGNRWRFEWVRYVAA